MIINNSLYKNCIKKCCQSRQFIRSQTDEYGKVTTYTYDFLTNLLKNVNFNGRVVSYDYDLLGNNTKVSQEYRSIIYHYEGLLLTGITVGELTYTFSYNKYHDIEKVLIGGTQILSNYYNNVDKATYKGEIGKTIYGEDVISFTYDEESRIKETFVNGILKNSYKYDSFSNIAVYTDHYTDTTYYYNYNLENKLVKIISSDGNNVTYSYDEEGYIVNTGNINGSTNYQYESTIDPVEDKKDDSKVIVREDFSKFRKEYNYSNIGLKKLNNTAIITGAAEITSSYYYEDIIKDGITYDSIRINHLNVKYKAKDKTYENGNIQIDYKYDEYNNISRILYSDGTITRTEDFSYDQFNQLTTHYDNNNGKVTITSYYYDSRGNITLIKKNDTTSGVISEILFGYNASGWKDQLSTVKINGQVYGISQYDSLGNPLKYLGYDVIKIKIFKRLMLVFGTFPDASILIFTVIVYSYKSLFNY